MTFYWHCRRSVIASPHRNDSLIRPRVNSLISQSYRFCSHRRIKNTTNDHTHWSGIHLVNFFFLTLSKQIFISESCRSTTHNFITLSHLYIRQRSVSMPIRYCFFFLLLSWFVCLFVWYLVLSCFRCLKYSFVALTLSCQIKQKCFLLLLIHMFCCCCCCGCHSAVLFDCFQAMRIRCAQNISTLA